MFSKSKKVNFKLWATLVKKKKNTSNSRTSIICLNCLTELIKKAICEFNPPENITCPVGQTIQVVSANYGRKDKWTCGEELADNKDCV